MYPPSKPEGGLFELPLTYLKHPLARPSMVLETLYRRLDTPPYLKGHKINESDLIRRAVATFVENLNETPEKQGKYLFV